MERPSFTSVFETRWKRRSEWTWAIWYTLSKNETVPMSFIEAHLEPETCNGEQVHNQWEWDVIACRPDLSFRIVQWVYQQLMSNVEHFLTKRSFFDKLSKRSSLPLEWFRACPDAPWTWMRLLCDHPHIPIEEVIDPIPLGLTLQYYHASSPQQYRKVSKNDIYRLCATRKLTLRTYTSLLLPPWNIFVFRDLLRNTIQNNETLRLEDVWDTWATFVPDEDGGIVELDNDDASDFHFNVPEAIEECQSLLSKAIHVFPTGLLEHPTEWLESHPSSLFLSVPPHDRNAFCLEAWDLLSSLNVTTPDVLDRWHDHTSWCWITLAQRLLPSPFSFSTEHPFASRPWFWRLCLHHPSFQAKWVLVCPEGQWDFSCVWMTVTRLGYHDTRIAWPEVVFALLKYCPEQLPEDCSSFIEHIEDVSLIYPYLRDHTWDWEKLSARADLSLEVVAENKDLPWDWWVLSKREDWTACLLSACESLVKWTSIFRHVPITDDILDLFITHVDTTTLFDTPDFLQRVQWPVCAKST